MKGALGNRGLWDENALEANWKKTLARGIWASGGGLATAVGLGSWTEGTDGASTVGLETWPEWTDWALPEGDRGGVKSGCRRESESGEKQCPWGRTRGVPGREDLIVLANYPGFQARTRKARLITLCILQVRHRCFGRNTNRARSSTCHHLEFYYERTRGKMDGNTGPVRMTELIGLTYRHKEVA